jgi:methanogenic corrinoid protein MtbC1
MPTPDASLDFAGYVQRILEAAETYRVADAEQLCIAVRETLPPMAMVGDVFAPVLREAGDRWERGEFSIVQEHVLTSAVRRQLHSALDQHNRHARGPLIVFTTLSGERHELGSLMLAVLASSLGVRAVYLGPDLPVAEVGRLCGRVAVAAVAVSVVTSAEVIDARAQLHDLRAALAPDLPLWVGGRGVAAMSADQLPAGTAFVSDLAQFKQRLAALPSGGEQT